MSELRARLIRTAFAFAVLTAAAVSACPVPVFRYALDHWPADAFRVEAPATVLSEGPVAKDLQGGGEAAPNIEAFPAADDSPARRVTVRFPADAGDSELWSGQLDAASYKALTESPARAEIARRVLAGESGVWVLVESGRRDADEAVARLLADQIAEVQKTATLPLARPGDPAAAIGPGPALRIGFSVLRVRRDAPQERIFLSALAGPGGLADFPDDAPFAALVFGRGRVLGAWSADRLTVPLIRGASGFLLGSCSCEAKRQNPGWDLLMRVNWEAELDKSRQPAGNPPPASPVLKLETVTYQPAAAAAVAPAPKSRWVTPVLAGVALLLAAALAGIVRKRP